MIRASWNEYFISVAKIVSSRATCPRLRVGAVLVKDKRIISTGYNGSLPGLPHCQDVGCILVDNHCTATTHAEINAIKFGDDSSVKSSVMYITHNPCANCVIALQRAGVRRIVYADLYKPVDYFNIGLNANELPDIVQLVPGSEHCVRVNY